MFTHNTLLKIKAVFSPLKRERLSSQDLLTAKFRQKKFVPSLAILSIVFILLMSSNSYAALSSTLVWEVRSTGASSNGGAYKPGSTGTDFSQQDAAQYALTGCTTAAANAIILNANAAADMVGNVLYVVSGTNFTVGWYEIISVVAGVSLTVDRNCTSAAGALGVVNVGGGVDHPNTISASVVAGNTVYIKNGTYVKVGANAYVLKTAVGGTIAAPITWIGYITNHTTVPTGTDRPYFDGGNDTTNCLLVGYGWNIFKYIRCARATSYGIYNNPTAYLTNIYCEFWFVKSSNNGDSGLYRSTDSSGQWDFIFGCELSSNTNLGGRSGNSGGYISADFCYIHDNTTNGISVHNYSNPTSHFIGCIFDSNGATGLTGFTGSGKIYNCVFYNNTGATSDGLYVDPTDTSGNNNDKRFKILNNISSANGRYGFNSAAALSGYPFTYFNYNLYNGNATAGLNGITAGANDLTSDPLFTDPANGDFSLQTGSPAIDAGFPQHSMAGATL